jgi:hypothetical protein
MQTKTGSLVETLASTVIGFGVALASQVTIFPWFGVHLPLTSNIYITCWFTLISVARGYFVRRLFNRIKKYHGSSSN